MAASVAVVTTVWRSVLSPDEVLRSALTRTSSPDWDHVILHPEDMDVSGFQAVLPHWDLRSAPAQHFRDVQAYNAWALTPEFWAQFTGHTHILIRELDAVLVRQPPGSALDFDFLGAPWDPPWRVVIAGGQMRIIRLFGRAWGRRLVVGNGGLSFRNVTAFREAATRLVGFADPRVLESTHEDAVWAYYARRLGLRFAPVEASRIFLDLRDDQSVDFDSVCGVHGVKESMVRANACLRSWAATRA